MNRPLDVATGSDGNATPANRKVDHERPFGPRFVTPLFIGSALNPINSSMIAIALVSIAGAMHVADGQTAILISSLYLTSAIAQPVAGRLSEEFGPRRVFLVGIVIVLVAGIIGGLARNIPTLVVARVLIGLGTSAGYPSAMLLVRRRATAVGLRAAARQRTRGADYHQCRYPRDRSHDWRGADRMVRLAGGVLDQRARERNRVRYGAALDRQGH